MRDDGLGYEGMRFTLLVILGLVGAVVGYNVGGAIGSGEARSIEFGLFGSVLGCAVGVLLALTFAGRFLRTR